MKKILLVEDDSNLGYVIQDNLLLNGYKVSLCTDGSLGWNEFQKNTFDLCLLDVMLPKKDGFNLAKQIKTVSDVPIIFITAKAMLKDKSTGFHLGADDYITKPFDLEELLLRIKAVLKRTHQVTTKGFHLGNTFFDSTNYQLIGNNTKKLTKKEGDLLKLLCLNKNNISKREIILTEIWGDDNYFNGRSLDVFITKLRKYLKEEESISIDNVHGIGFCLKTS